MVMKRPESLFDNSSRLPDRPLPFQGSARIFTD